MLHRSGRLVGMGVALFILVVPLLRVRGLVRFEGPRACRETVGGAVLRRLRAFLLALIVGASVIPFVALPVHAAPPAGSLDPTFGDGGKVMTEIDGGGARSVAVQADGKIVVGGQGNSGSPTSYDFAVVRYNPDGSLDPSFDGDGIALTDIGDTVTERVLAISVQSDGKIVALGIGGTPPSFAAVRYNSDGSLDTAFGGDGIVTHAGAPVPVAMALQDDDKIVSVSGHGCLALVRLNSDGSLDTSFDDDGMVLTDLGFLSAAAHGVAIEPGGKIVIVGGTDQVTYSQSDFVVARYLTTGVLDVTFGDDGIVVADPLGTGGVFEDVALDGDGKIVVVGRSASGAALARFNADGSLDASFDGDGIAVGEGAALAVQSDSRIVTVGTNGTDWELSRYLADGSPDTSFGANGVVTTNDTFTYATDVGLQADGRILVVGAASDPGFAVARYEKGEQPPEVSVSSPANWSTVGSPVSVVGSATDDVGVTQVVLEIYDRDTSQWWNGSGWQAGRTSLDAVLGAGTTSRAWSYGFSPPVPAASPYWVTVRSVDGAANMSPYSYLNFTVSTSDSVAPEVSVSSPANWSTVFGPIIEIAGTASDNDAVDVVRLEIYDRVTGDWWNGSGWQTGRITVDAMLVGTDWIYEFSPDSPYSSEPYWVTARSFDVSGNASPYVFRNFAVE